MTAMGVCCLVLYKDTTNLANKPAHIRYQDASAAAVLMYNSDVSLACRQAPSWPGEVQEPWNSTA